MDSIYFWNTIALELLRISHSDPAKREQNGPVLSARALAIAHLPDLTNENIGGVGLGLRIARDIFDANGRAPKQTPNTDAVPPIITSPANTPMPLVPAQPANVGGCANAQMSGFAAASEGSEEETAAGTTDQTPFPSGVSEQDQESPSTPAQGAWPSGISQQ